MARLVMRGDTAVLETLVRAEIIGLGAHKKEKRPGMKDKKALAANAVSDSENAKDERVGPDDKHKASGHGRGGQGTDESANKSPDVLSSVSISAFSISKGSDDQGVVVKFNIKNTTQNAKEVSGRVFCVLNPADTTTDKWVVIPEGGSIQGGVPGPYNQGHYFSISRFKPVKFSVHTTTPLQNFSNASVFIFDETEKLLLETTRDIKKIKQD